MSYFDIMQLLSYQKSRGVAGWQTPAEGVAEDKARWRVVARHDDVAEARGRLPPTKNLLFRFPFLYITPCTRKGGIERSLSAQAGRSFFYPQRRISREKREKEGIRLGKAKFFPDR